MMSFLGKAFLLGLMQWPGGFMLSRRGLMNNRLPTFIGIGAMKSGTTSLYAYLSIHPEIEMSVRKETDFFMKFNNLEKNLSWYESSFSGNRKIRGEISPTYTKYPQVKNVPERMREILPDVKILYIVREPIDRIISHVWHHLVMGRGDNWFESIQEAIDRKDLLFNEYVSASVYKDQLTDYLKYFPKEQILVLAFDELKNRPEAFMAKVCRFLGVDVDYYNKKSFDAYHKTDQKRSPTELAKYIMAKMDVYNLKKNIPACIYTPIKNLLMKTHQIQTTWYARHHETGTDCIVCSSGTGIEKNGSGIGVALAGL